MIKCEECGKVFQFKSHLKRHQTYSSCAKIVPKPEQPRVRLRGTSMFAGLTTYMTQPICTAPEPTPSTAPMDYAQPLYNCTYPSSFNWAINP